MYNRYIRNDNGSCEYAQEPSHAKSHTPPQAQRPSRESPPSPPPPTESPPSSRAAESRFLNQLLEKLHLGDLDSGDLLLLLLLFLLLRENADEELLIALGLLLIL